MDVNDRKWLGLTLAIAGAVALGGGTALAAVKNKVPMPRPRPAAIHVAAAPAKGNAAVPAKVTVRDVPMPRRRPDGAGHRIASAEVGNALRGSVPAAPAAAAPTLAPAPAPVGRGAQPFVIAPTAATPAADVEALKRVIEAARKGREGDADEAQRAISDPLARKLAEYMILRSDNTNPSYARYAAFVDANPSWPHARLFRRRAENALWNDKVEDATVRAFFAVHKPSTAKGRFVLARALLAEGDRDGAAALVRTAWRYEDCSAEVEKMALDMFGSLITPADDKVRMQSRFYADDVAAGTRAGERLGGSDLAIARARAAVIKRAGNAKALLDAVPASARGDAGYIFARVEWLRKHDKPEDAGHLILSAPRDAASVINPDQWWMERRVLVRRLLDDHDAQTAYRVARDAATPQRGNFRVDQQFTAGWIALRFLHDPKTAAAHFAQIPQDTTNPQALGRRGYWLGRAAEAMGHMAEAKAYYEQGARHSATYYGQLARARLGLADLGLRGPPELTPEQRTRLSQAEIVRAVELLYALDERDMLASIYAELGESATDAAGMAMLAEVAARHHDGRAVVLIGGGGFGRGLPLDYYAYPAIGLPNYTPIAPPIDWAVAYSIARQESHFNQKVVSSAHAMGLMQVTPEAAIDTAKRYKVAYNRGRLLSDPVYNMQMGAAELSMLLGTYNGSYILTFAGYNAGRGRVRQWIAAYGDPRDPHIDPVDWVERIPLSETRNYVQRIMENLQVYRARFGGSQRLVIEADIKRGGTN